MHENVFHYNSNRVHFRIKCIVAHSKSEHGKNLILLMRQTIGAAEKTSRSLRAVLRTCLYLYIIHNKMLAI